MVGRGVVVSDFSDDEDDAEASSSEISSISTSFGKSGRLLAACVDAPQLLPQ